MPMDTFYVFVNFLRGIAGHNLKFTRQFTSAAWSACLMDDGFREKYIAGTATYAPWLAATPDCHIISPFTAAALESMAPYRVEYEAERIRLMHFPRLPSRLSATYAFGDIATCETVAKKYAWDLS